MVVDLSLPCALDNEKDGHKFDKQRKFCDNQKLIHMAGRRNSALLWTLFTPQELVVLRGSSSAPSSPMCTSGGQSSLGNQKKANTD